MPFHKLGCRVWGADYDERMIAYGRTLGLNLEAGGAELLSSHEPPDVMILCHVLEHIPDPAAFLQVIHQHLHDDSAMLVEVPSLEVLATDGYHNNLFEYLQIAHVFYFSLNTLCYVLECSGFACTRLTCCRVLARKGRSCRPPQEVYAHEYEYALRLLRTADVRFFRNELARCAQSSSQ